jgi:hypothetical protein
MDVPPKVPVDIRAERGCRHEQTFGLIVQGSFLVSDEGSPADYLTRYLLREVRYPVGDGGLGLSPVYELRVLLSRQVST